MKTTTSRRARPNRRPVRLTRRGRLTLTLLTVALTAGVATATGQGAVATDESRDAGTAVHVVRPGETLWSIARRVAPEADTRQTVGRIMDLNGMASASVAAGRALVVPA